MPPATRGGEKFVLDSELKAWMLESFAPAAAG